MSELHPELLRARELFGELQPAPATRTRIRTRIETGEQRSLGFSFVSRALFFAVVTWASLSAASYGAHWFGSANKPALGTTQSASSEHSSKLLHAAPRGNHWVQGSAEPVAQPVAQPHPVEAPSRVLNRHSARRAAPRARPAVDSELSLQVSRYEEATALVGSNPTEALRQLGAFRHRWPASALAHEVDLRVIQLLVQLGDATHAREEARAFVVHYPQSPHRSEVDRLIGPR